MKQMKKYNLKKEYTNVQISLPNYKLGTGTITIDTKIIEQYDPEILIAMGFHIFDITEVEETETVKKYTNEKNERKSKRSQE